MEIPRELGLRRVYAATKSPIRKQIKNELTNTLNTNEDTPSGYVEDLVATAKETDLRDHERLRLIFKQKQDHYKCIHEQIYNGRR